MSLPKEYREIYGETEYFKFVRTLHTTSRDKGRLLYWQQRKLELLLKEDPLAISFEEVLASFPFEEAKEPTLEEVLPLHLERIRSIGVLAFADENDIVRSVSKTGSIAHVQYLTALEPHLTKAEVLEFYIAIRGSGRCETEWRPEFCLIFGRKLGEMPEPMPMHNFPWG